MTYARISKALAAHQNWLSNFENLLSEWPDSADKIGEPGDFTLCEFGQWLASEAKEYIDTKSLARLYTTHAVFHKKAAELIDELKTSGKTTAADRLFNDARQCSMQLTSFLLLEKNRFPAGSK